MNQLNSSITQRTLEAQILDRLREAILEGVFPPGSPLNQVEVAAQFGVSRGPIRAALAKLEEEGLVKNVPHKGTVVTTLDRKMVRDLYGVRAVLEAYAVELAVPRYTEEDFQKLKDAVELMKKAASEGNTSEVIRYDFQVHQLLVEMSGNAVLAQTWNTIKVQVRRALSFRHHGYPNLQEIADSHDPLLEKFLQKDIEGAVEVMIAHTNDACEDLMERWTLTEGASDISSIWGK